MKKVQSLLIAVIMVTALQAQDKLQYAAALIPDSLKLNVNVVVREDVTKMEINRPGKGKESIKRVVTVLNEKGNAELTFYEWYDKFRKIEDVDISLYDEFGRFVRRSRKRDLQHESYSDGSSFVDDTKIIHARARIDRYPVTIEIIYEVGHEGMLEYNDFYLEEIDATIQSKIYSITSEKNNKVRFKNYKCNIQPKIKEEGEKITYTWEIKNTKPFIKEAGAAKGDLAHVIISPTLFNMDGYQGDMTSWESFGKWNAMLIAQTNKLPEPNAAFYRDLVKNAKSNREKVEILYKHLQENYRYVGIQLGIGGLKPFPAEFVERKKYGDCKALTNFMQAMLNTINIRSHYALINSGYNEMAADKNFPHDFADHVILCVPEGKDTIWLECTSRTQPFGKLGGFTENRNAFLITESGGVIVSTPKSEAQDNVVSTFSTIKLAEDGSGEAKFDLNHKGRFTDMLNHYLVEGKEEEKKYYLFQNSSFKHGDDLKIIANAADRQGMICIQMNYEKVPDFSAGSKHFLSPRMYKFWTQALPKVENRTTDYYIGFPQTQADTTIYILPDGYVVESLPKAAKLQFPLGDYESDYKFDAAKKELITTCRITIKKNYIPADQYQDAARFFSDVIKEQQQKVVVRKED